MNPSLHSTSKKVSVPSHLISSYIVLASFYTKTPKHMMAGAADGEEDKDASAAFLEELKKEHPVSNIFKVARNASKERKFLESFEVIMKLNVDPKYHDQNVRGTCVLPAGTGTEVKICVFSGNEYHDDAKEAGADLIGTDKVLSDIADGKIEFDKIIATPEQMQTLKKYARILGPRGLMPNVKSGTLVKQNELID